MKKKDVLHVLANSWFALTPDKVRDILGSSQARCSTYTCLLLLEKQKLVVRTKNGARLAYRISKMGMQRLEYWKQKQTAKENQQHAN